MIVIDEDIADRGDSAQALVDDLRRCGALDMQTIIVITSSAPTRSRVTEAAELGVDAYLLKPFSLSAMQMRLRSCILRREAMQPIYEAIRRKDWDGALEGCLTKMANRDALWIYSARIAAEIFILQGKPQMAQQMYEEILKAEALPWARLGIGRALAEQGRHESALEQIQALMQSDAEQTDGYDIMGRIYMERGDAQAALHVYRLAAQATPRSVSRLQRYGMACYYAGEWDVAVEVLRRSIDVGARSMAFDLQAFVILALIFYDRKDEKSLFELTKRFVSFRQGSPHAPQRLDHIAGVLDAVYLCSLGTLSAVREIVHPMLPTVESDDFDFEQACSVIALLSIIASKYQEDPLELWTIEYLGLRFSHSKYASEWMASFARAHPRYVEILEKSHKRAFDITQKLVRSCIRQDIGVALQAMVDAASEYKNARIIEAADKMLERHANKSDKRAHLEQRMREIKLRHDPVVLKRNPINRHLRHPGGISLFNRLLVDEVA